MALAPASKACVFEMPEFSIQITASAVAWYGAIVATASALIAFFNYLSERRKIKVTISHGFLVYGRGLEDRLRVFINAANIGKRPVTVNTVGFRLKNGNDIVLMETPSLQLPFTIEEGRSCQTWIDKKELLGEIKKAKTKIKFGWYRDSTGKYYKGRSGN